VPATAPSTVAQSLAAFTALVCAQAPVRLMVLVPRMVPMPGESGDLGLERDEIESGHCPALSRPRELAARLEGHRMELGIP
jgi:hypothetical protein